MRIKNLIAAALLALPLVAIAPSAQADPRERGNRYEGRNHIQERGRGRYERRHEARSPRHGWGAPRVNLGFHAPRYVPRPRPYERLDDRVWIRGHWDRFGCWVPGHWVYSRYY